MTWLGGSGGNCLISPISSALSGQIRLIRGLCFLSDRLVAICYPFPTIVPALPATICSISASAPMAAGLPVWRTNGAGSLHLGPHGASGEVIGIQFIGRGAVDLALLRRAPVDIDAVHIGGHDERSASTSRPAARGPVFVDDRLDAGQPPLLARLVHGRDAAAASADHDRVLLEQPLDGPESRRSAWAAATAPPAATVAPSCLKVQPFSAANALASAFS